MFNQPKVVILLKNRSLLLFVENGLEAKTLTFGPEFLENLEIVDKEKFDQAILSFLNSTALANQNAILVLAESVLFHKTLPLIEIHNEAQTIETFTDEIPLDSHKIARKIIKTDKELNLISTNKELYESLINAFEVAGWKITAVVPIYFFGGLSSSDSFNPNEVKSILSDELAVRVGNFLSSSPVPNISSKNVMEISEQSPKTNLWPLFISLFLIGLSMLMLYFAWDQIKNFLKPADQNIASSSAEIINLPLPEITASPSASIATPSAVPTTPKPTLIDKATLKIQVLNGTGVAGQAKVVEDKLTLLGYNNIETSNAVVYGNTTAKVIFGDKIPAGFKESFTEELSVIFITVKESDSLINGDFDIVVSTGTLKNP